MDLGICFVIVGGWFVYVSRCVSRLCIRLVFLLSQIKCDIHEISDGCMGCGNYFQLFSSSRACPHSVCFVCSAIGAGLFITASPSSRYSPMFSFGMMLWIWFRI